MKYELQKIGDFKFQPRIVEADFLPREDEGIYQDNQLLGYVHVVFHSIEERTTRDSHKGHTIVRIR